mmetsp:Transcript_144542/g.277330  ORF Transcript_144542/g.277330 Transcript_144542/m.277330 type:complete len:201 (-) Transcript_144542:758-1360(-)
MTQGSRSICLESVQLRHLGQFILVYCHAQRTPFCSSLKIHEHFWGADRGVTDLCIVIKDIQGDLGIGSTLNFLSCNLWRFSDMEAFMVLVLDSVMLFEELDKSSLPLSEKLQDLFCSLGDFNGILTTCVCVLSGPIRVIDSCRCFHAKQKLFLFPFFTLTWCVFRYLLLQFWYKIVLQLLQTLWCQIWTLLLEMQLTAQR